jgi:anthranilate synthase component II
MILVIDNYDSFTYNLVQALGKKTQDILVMRNNEITSDEIAHLAPRGIVLSPGPGKPEHAGITVEVIQRFGSKIPILGVCLGHQAIGFAFGARVTYAPTLMHGRTSMVTHSGKTILKSVSNPLRVGRYHSLVISPDTFPNELKISARTHDGIIMGVTHRTFPIEGIQFHPESVLTQEGEKILTNWLEVYKIL